MKESFYFKHDYGARQDPKIIKMMSVHGLEGYGIFWGIVEMLASETGRIYLPKEYESIAYEMRTQCERIKSVVEDFGLFEFDDSNFWSKRLDSDNDQRAIKSEKAKKNAKARWDKQRKKANSMQTHCGSDANAMLGEDRKGKDNINNSIAIRDDLEKIVDSWNNDFKKTKPSKNTTIKVGQNIFMECRKVSSFILSAYKKLKKEYSPDDFKHTFTQYAIERSSRDPSEDYAKQRFSLGEFLTQKNGFLKFYERND